MHLDKCIVAASGALLVVLLAAVAYLMGVQSGDSAARRPQEQSNTSFQAPSEPRITKATGPVSRTSAQSPSESSPLIDSCYHLDSCGFGKLLETNVVDRRGDDKLVKALVQWGEVENPTGTDSDESRIKWSSEKDVVYALCSKEHPSIAFRDGEKFLAEEFDFVGETGISGVQQNNANVYQALCHGFFANELADRATSLGYKPVQDGGRGQFEVNSPEELFAG